MRSSFTLLLLLFVPLGVRAQQLITSSPSIPSAGACSFETWGDVDDRWAEASCAPVAGLQLELDLGYRVVEGEALPLISSAFRVPFSRRAPGRLGLTVDAELEVEPDEVGGRLLAQGTTLSLLSAYELPGEQATVFGNVGWVHALRGDRLNELAYGARLEVPLTEQFTAIGEAYGEGYGAGYQAAVRWRPLPDRLSAVVGYGGVLLGDGGSRNGVTLGLVWSPPAFVQSGR